MIKPNRTPNPFVLPLAIYALVHLLLLVFNLGDPDAILRGDRSTGRHKLLMQATGADADTLAALFLQHGLPGDWLFHLPFYVLGGYPAVIVAQVLAGALSLVAAVGLARELGASPRVASLAGLLLVLLPGAVMNPHVLVTESFYTAALSVGLWRLALALRHTSRRELGYAFALLTLAAMIRPQAMPFTVLAAVSFSAVAPALRRSVIVCALVSLLVMPGLWLGWRYAETGQVSLGPSNFDIGFNLHMRAARIGEIARLPGYEQLTTQTLIEGGPPARMAAPEFLQLVREHPAAAAKTYTSDAANFAFNPGSNGVFGQFLQLYEAAPDSFFWKRQIDTLGVWGMFKVMLSMNAAFLVSFVFCFLIHGLLLLGVLFGVWRVLRQPALRPLVSVLALVVAAQIGVVFISGIVRWGHRTPLEPLLAALAVQALLLRVRPSFQP